MVQPLVRDDGRHPPRVGFVHQKQDYRAPAGVLQGIPLHCRQGFANSIISVDIFEGIWYIYSQNDEMAQITVRSQVERPEGAYHPFPSPEWKTL